MNLENLLEKILPAAKIMGQGMAGIFVVMGAIALIVFLFTKAVKKK